MSPFLFLWKNLELTNSQLLWEIYNLLWRFEIDKNSLFHLPDTWESLKIEEIRNFLAYGNEKPRFKFQIFFIENISRMTTQSANAALKFFEEPGEGNIIILTSTSEANILDTVLSRVQIVPLYQQSVTHKNPEYIEMASRYFENGDIDFVSFLYTQKLEKSDYREILRIIFEILSKKSIDMKLLEELEKDMQGLEKNNLNGKYIVDKYLA